MESLFQKILGSTVKSGLKNFGSSISGDVDVDGNKYPGTSLFFFLKKVKFKVIPRILFYFSTTRTSTQMGFRENKQNHLKTVRIKVTSSTYSY